MDDHLPHDGVLGDVGGVDEGFEQVDRRDADDCRGQLDLEHARIHMGQPLGLVGVAVQVEPRDEGLVAADDHHDQQVGDHHHVDQAQHHQHGFGFADVAAGVDDRHQQVAEFGHEQPHVDALGDDQAKVERGLEPAAPEDEAFELLRTFAHVGELQFGEGRILSSAKRGPRR